MLKKTLVAITLFTGLSSGAAVASSALSAAFHEYSSPGGSYDGSNSVGGMNVYIGPGYGYRNNINMNRSLFNISPPTWNAGCGGIDFFSGSFSIITRDELVQMGRGIMQGAPGYFFNLAIDSICPGCAANMKDLSAKLNAYNQIGQDSCNMAWDFVSTNTGIEKGAEWLNKNVGSKVQANMNTAIGNIPDYGFWMTSQSDSSAQQDGDCAPHTPCSLLDEDQFNLVKLALHGASAPAFISTLQHQGLSDDITDVDLVQSAVGTLVYRIQANEGNAAAESSLDIEQFLSRLNFRYLFDTKCVLDNNNPTADCVNPRTATAPITRPLDGLKCPAPSAANTLEQNRCLEPIEASLGEIEGIVTRFERMLPRIVNKISSRQVPLDNEELNFTRNYRLNYAVFAKIDPSVIESYARIAGIAMARRRINEFASQIEMMLVHASLTPLLRDDGATAVFSQDDVKKLIEAFRTEVRNIDKDYEEEWKQRTSELSLTLELQRILQGALGV